MPIIMLNIQEVPFEFHQLTIWKGSLKSNSGIIIRLHKHAVFHYKKPDAGVIHEDAYRVLPAPIYT
ncbi:hypothetical protein HHI36_002568, partial [Cryptolaemus montrouzieri]